MPPILPGVSRSKTVPVAPMTCAPEATAQPTLTKRVWRQESQLPASCISVAVATEFDTAVTNPGVIEATFSAKVYYPEAYTDIFDCGLFLHAKTSKPLNALASPPDPSTVEVDVAMANDEGQTASHTIRF